MLAAARAADLIEVGPHVRQVVIDWGLHLEAASGVDGVGEAVADGPSRQSSYSTRHLRAAEPRGPGDGSHRSSPAPPRRTMSAILKVVAEVRRQQFLATDEARDCTPVNNAGGPNAGNFTPAGLEATNFADEAFTEIVRWRLGIPAQTHAALCQNVTAAGVVSEEVMNPHCDSAMACSIGPLRIKRHDDVADCLADIIDECGAHVRRETYMKNFSTEASDAWLDIWVFGGLHVPELILDMTVCHPVVARYQPRVSQRAGTAAAIAKQGRCAQAQGRKNIVFAMETRGRLGEAAEELLPALAEAATLRARRRGQDATAGSFLRRWRPMCDGILQRGVAAAPAISNAWARLAGKPHKRWCK